MNDTPLSTPLSSIANSKKKNRRLLTALAIIGWIVLIPALVASVGFAYEWDPFGFRAAEKVAKNKIHVDNFIRGVLIGKNIPSEIVDLALRNEPIPEGDYHKLSPEQRDVVDSIQSQRGAYLSFNWLDSLFTSTYRKFCLISLGIATVGACMVMIARKRSLATQCS